jgi:integrase
MTINFYIERKQLKTAKKAIYAYIRGLTPGKTIILNTGESIEPRYWDKNHKRAISKGKGKYSEAFDLNAFLDSFEVDINKTIRTYRTDNPAIEYDQIKSVLLRKYGKIKQINLGFYEALDEFIKVRKSDLTEGSLKKFSTLKDHLIKFEKKKHFEISFQNINLIFYDKFLSFLLFEKKMVNNSAYKMIGILKNFLNWATEREYNSYTVFKKFKLKEDMVDIITLTNEELMQLRKFDFSYSARLERARDLFEFGCYTGGRFSDLVNIDRSDIQDNKWTLRTIKTRDIIEIPLNDYALKILEKYKDETFPLPRISNQKLNKYIKEVAKKVKLTTLVKIVKYKGSETIESIKQKQELISTHTARRTFITQSLLRGMKTEVVMSISGHKNYRSFKKYINITFSDKQRELNRIWDLGN